MQAPEISTDSPHPASQAHPAVTLSIVIPSYNQGRFLPQCLAEPLRLSAGGVETIVIDGGSTDETINVLKERDAHISFWISEPDNGQADAINRGFAIARGKWLAFQNSDDYYLPGALDLILRWTARVPDAEVIIGGVHFVNADQSLRRKTLPKPLSYIAMSQLNFVHNQSFFIHRDLLKRVGALDKDAHFCLDYQWFIRVFRQTVTVLYVNDYIGAQRMHPDTKTSRLQHIQAREFSRYAAAHYTRLQRMIGRLFLPAYRLFRGGYGIAIDQTRIRAVKVAGCASWQAYYDEFP